MTRNKETIVEVDCELQLRMSPTLRFRLYFPDLSRRCKRCRQHKIKCTGSRPCAHCQKRNVPCASDESARKILVARDRLLHLEQQAAVRMTSEALLPETGQDRLREGPSYPATIEPNESTPFDITEGGLLQDSLDSDAEPQESDKTNGKETDVLNPLVLDPPAYYNPASKDQAC
jgi:hypothetical protein